MELPQIPPKMRRIIREERLKDLEGLTNLSKPELSILKFQVEVEKKIRELEKKLRREILKKRKFWSLRITLGFLVAGIFFFVPHEYFFELAKKFPKHFKIFFGFVVGQAIASLTITFYLGRLIQKIFTKVSRSKEFNKDEMGLVYMLFEEADEDDPRALKMNASEVANYIKRELGEIVDVKGLGRKLKKRFKQNKSRKYILRKK